MKKNIIKFLKNPIIFIVLVIILITVSTLFLNNNYVILDLTLIIQDIMV